MLSIVVLRVHALLQQLFGADSRQRLKTREPKRRQARALESLSIALLCCRVLVADHLRLLSVGYFRYLSRTVHSTCERQGLSHEIQPTP